MASSSSSVAAGKQTKQASLTCPTAKKAESSRNGKPTGRDDEAKTANPRQGAEASQRVDERGRFVAEKVVHLIPVENIDGTMNYLLIEADEHGKVQVNEAKGPRMTQEPPELIFVDQPTDGQKILQAITAPVPLPGKAIGVVQRGPIKTPPGPGPEQAQPIPKPKPSVSTRRTAVSIQSNEGSSEAQVFSAEPVDVPQEDIQLETAEEGQQVIGVEDGTEQLRVLALDDVMSHGGRVQFENPIVEVVVCSDGASQVRLSDGSVVELVQDTGTGQLYLMQEDGTLIDPVEMGIDLSTIGIQVQEAPGPN